MTWARLDDQFTDHEKVEALTDPAFRLHVSGIVLCARLETNGRILGGKVPRLVPRYKAAHLAELVAGGLWHPDGHDCQHPTCQQPGPGNYWVHDFLQCNPSREDTAKRRQEAADRQRRARERKEAEATAKRAAVTRDVTRDVRRESQRPDPTRPDLPPTEVGTGVGSGEPPPSRPECHDCGGSGWLEVAEGAVRCEHRPRLMAVNP